MGLKLEYDKGQTPLSESEKEGLRIKTLTTQGELDEHEQRNIEKALEWTIHNNFSSQRILNEKFIKQLHKKMFDDVWIWAGSFRKSEKNIGTSWIKISLELRTLLDDAKFWLDEKVYSADEFAIRFKHRLVSIHCFPNGNGRHSRIMADIIVEAIFDKEIFTWHSTNMVNAGAVRSKYIVALREADKGNIEPLVLFARA